MNIRTMVKSVLAEHGKANKFYVNSSNFPCLRFGGCYSVVTIKGWTPDPAADEISKKIKAMGDKEQVGLLVTFSGSGFAST